MSGLHRLSLAGGRARGPGAFREPVFAPEFRGGAAGFSRDGLVEQRGESGGGRGPGAVGRAHGRAAAAAQVNRAVSLHAVKYRLIELLTRRVPAEKNLGGTDRVVPSQSSECASRSHGATAGALALALLPLPTPRAKNCVLNMHSLFQRQCAPTLG